MGLLDKLKPLPRWKHADPVIRLEAVRELDDPTELSALAESDPDARVRRAATARVVDPEVLGRLSATDADGDVRDRAADRLLVLACRADRSQESDPEADRTALAAVRALADPRRLSTVAKGDAPEAVRTEALSRITDARALGSIARHAKSEATAAAAAERLTDSAELLEVALRSEHRDVALAAFEHLAPTADVALLKTVETRAQQKAVGRRARTRIQEIEAAEAARRAAAEDRRRREAMLCEAIEQVAAITDVTVARAEVQRLNEAWTALDVTEEAARQRFAAGVSAAEAAIVRREREAEEATERARQRAEAVATCEALCARVETLDGDDVLEQLAPIDEEWRSLLPLVGNSPEADRLAERFALAVAACRKRHEMGTALAEAGAKLEALVVAAEALASDADAAAAAARWPGLSREARGLTATLSAASRLAPELAARLEAAGQTIAEHAAAREAAAEAEAAKVRLAALTQLQRLTDRARRASEADAITLREGDRLMRDIAQGIESAGRGPASREIDETVTKLRTLQEALAPRVRELREMDEWRRFANAQRQEQLIAMAEAIVTSLKAEEEAGKTSDLAATARALRELHAKWHEVAEAPRNVAQRLWDRFRTATDFIRSRCEVHFAKVREDRAASLEKRAAMVAEAEALAASTDWAKAAARFQQLQSEWRELGPAGRETGRELSARFRAASGTFFTRRREDMTTRRQVWSENMARKEALCARAEELATSTDWDAAASEMKRLQADWKTIGPVRRNKSEEIWTRFRTAADAFFERFHHRHEITLATKLAEREALVVELESLSAATEAPADLGEKVQQLRTTWNRSVPIPTPEAKVLTDRWQAALGRLVQQQPDAFKSTDLDPTAIVQRMEKLVARVESFLPAQASEGSKELSPTEMLAARLRSALASNAMGGRSSEEVKWRAAADAVKDAQAAWQRLGPTPAPEARALETRFRDACRRILDQARRHGGGGHGQGHSGHGQGQGQAPRRQERQAAAV